MKKLLSILALSASMFLASCSSSDLPGLIGSGDSKGDDASSVVDGDASNGENTAERLVEIIEAIADNAHGSVALGETYFYDTEGDYYYVDIPLADVATCEEGIAFAQDYLPAGYSVLFAEGYLELFDLYCGMYSYDDDSIYVQALTFEEDGNIILEYDAFLATEDDPDDSEPVYTGDADAEALMEQIVVNLFGEDPVLGETHEFDADDGSYWTAVITDFSSPEAAIQYAAEPLPEGYTVLDGPAYYEEGDLWYVDFGYDNNHLIVEVLSYDLEGSTVLQYAVYVNDGTWGIGEEEPGEALVETLQNGSGNAYLAFRDLFDADEEFTGISGEYVMITASKNSGDNPPKYYANGFSLRLYASNTLTISVAEGYVIDKVILTMSDDSKNPLTDLTAVGGTYVVNGSTGTLTCNNVDTVTFSYNLSKGHVRIAAIEVTFSAVE